MNAHPLHILNQLTQLRYTNNVSMLASAHAQRGELTSILVGLLERELSMCNSMIEQLSVVRACLFNADVSGIQVGPLREFIPLYVQYLLQRIGHIPPFRRLSEGDIEFLVIQCALPAAEARSFSGVLAPELVISVDRFDAWFAPMGPGVFSFCQAMEIVNEIWPYWNSESQQTLPGVLWNGRTIHGFISGTDARAYLATAAAGTFLIRFGTTGGLTVDVKNKAGRLEKKNISVEQLRERPLHRWLHEMDGAEILEFLHVPGAAPLNKGDCFPHHADNSGYIQPDSATFGADDDDDDDMAGNGGGFTFASTGYENVDD